MGMFDKYDILLTVTPLPVVLGVIASVLIQYESIIPLLTGGMISIIFMFYSIFIEAPTSSAL